ncbi:MAG: alanine--glyoxylate aminotransferase family protein, partial [Alphaproteobacteria bacterium]
NADCPSASVLSLLDWKNAWSKNEPFPFTPAIAEVNGLNAAIDLYLEEGPETVWQRHALTARACRSGVKALGLTLWPVREEIASPTATTINVPAGMDDEQIRMTMREIYGTIISGGRGDTAGKLLRIGHMGPVAEPIYAVVVITALAGALSKLGHDVNLGAGVEAASAVILNK